MAVSDTNRNPRYDVEITKDSTTVGFNLTDNQGKLDGTAIKQELQPRVSIKMHQGGTKHSAYEPPYATYEQRDWSGGRGLDDIDLDETRYFDGSTINAWMEGKLLLGPQATYGSGYRSADDNMWQSDYTHTSGIGSAQRLLGAQFTASASYTATTIYVIIRRVGTPAADLTVALYSDTGGLPNAELASSTCSLGSTALAWEWAVASVTVSQALTSGTVYHVVVGDVTDVYDASNYYGVMTWTDSSPGDGSYSASGATPSWQNDVYVPYFRVTDADTDFKAQFFHYMEIPHAAFTYTDGTAPKVYMNGDFGRVTASTSTTITDSTKSWTADEWINATVVLVDGKGQEAVWRYRTITDNDATSLTVASWDVTPDTSTYYSIINTNLWKEITGHGMLNGPVTDVLSHGNIAYLMRGDRRDAIAMRHPRLSTGGFEDLSGTRGTFITHARDSNGQNRLWKIKRTMDGQLEKSKVPWGGYTDATYPLDWGQDVSVTNGDMELDASWGTVGSPNTVEQSSEQEHGGTYSWKLETAADAEGISQTLTVTSADRYTVSAWVYVVSGSSNGVKLMLGGAEIDTVGTGFTNQWVQLRGNRQAASASEDVEILSDGGTAEFYVDDVEIFEHPVYTPVTGTSGRVTNLLTYGEPERCWVLTNNAVYMEDNGNLLPIPIKEFENAADDRNGFGALVHGVYLYLSFHNSLERYYKSNLDDVGPTRDEGLPSGRQGSIPGLGGYPGRIYAAIDGGSTDTSSVMLYNMLGWHEVYRAPVAGKRIRSLLVQPIPGTTIDRLWISCGGDLIWVPIDLNPQNNSNYRYTYQSTIETQYIFYNKKDVEKFWKSVATVTEGMTTNGYLYGYFKVEGDTSWTYINSFNTSPITTRDIASTNDTVGKGIKFKFIMKATAQTATPEIKAITTDFIEQVPTKESWTMTFIAEDANISLQGGTTYDRVETNIAQLQTWLDEPDPAAIASTSSLVDGKNVKVLSLSYKPILIDPESQVEKHLCTLTVIEV